MFFHKAWLPSKLILLPSNRNVEREPDLTGRIIVVIICLYTLHSAHRVGLLPCVEVELSNWVWYEFQFCGKITVGCAWQNRKSDSQRLQGSDTTQWLSPAWSEFKCHIDLWVGAVSKLQSNDCPLHSIPNLVYTLVRSLYGSSRRRWSNPSSR
jgi:hypothetical protein